MNAPHNTPEYTLGIRFTRRGKTVFIGVATFLCSGIFLLGSAVPTTDVAPPAPPAAIVQLPKVYVTQELGDALAEGDDTEPAHADTRKWESCTIEYGMILCPDGFTQSLE